jgi:hypothetical protein
LKVSDAYGGDAYGGVMARMFVREKYRPYRLSFGVAAGRNSGNVHSRAIVADAVGHRILLWMGDAERVPTS